MCLILQLVYAVKWVRSFFVARNKLVLMAGPEQLRISLTVLSFMPWKCFNSNTMRSRGVSLRRAREICTLNSRLNSCCSGLPAGLPSETWLIRFSSFSSVVLSSRRGPISPQVIQTEVGDNAIDPGRDRALKAEATELFVDLYECFLMDILSNVVRAGDT